MGLGAPELLIILGIVVLLFGGAKLPKLARSLGEAQRELRAGQAEGASAATPSVEDAR
jgi:sec-independent protein translocase protein TatA